jgi:peptidase M48-like protein
MFMRLTMAVSRQQEFVADETAAHISGAAPMVSALKKVAMLAPAYSAYLQQEVLPILQYGFLPPLAEGFDRFIASPETRTAFDRMAREQIGDAAGEFDTHPPLSERVAALERLPVVQAANTTERSLPMLANPEKHALLLLEHNAGTDTVRQLNAITWDDVGDSIYAKEWHRIAEAHVASFATMTIGDLPAGKKAYTEFGAGLKNKGESFVDADERLGRAAHVMIAGLGAALLRAGWKMETGPGRPLELKNGEASVIPRRVVGRLIDNAEAEPRIPNPESLLRHHHGVDDVDDAIGLIDIRRRDRCGHPLAVLQPELAVLHRDPQRVATDRLQLGRALTLVHSRHQRLRIEPAGHHVIGEHRLQHVQVIGPEQHVHCAAGQFLERRIGRGEHRERSRSLERVNKPCRFHGRDERGVILRVHRVLDDVLRGIHGGAADHDCLLFRCDADCCQNRQRRAHGDKSSKHRAPPAGVHVLLC